MTEIQAAAVLYAYTSKQAIDDVEAAWREAVRDDDEAAINAAVARLDQLEAAIAKFSPS